MYIVCSIVLFFCFGCNQNKNYDNDTSLFNGYLESTFSTSIPNDSMTYVLVSDNCCISCFHAIGDIFEGKNCVVILGKKNAQKRAILNVGNGKVYVDNSDHINHIKYTKDNICFIKVCNGLIYKIDTPEPFEIKEYIASNIN